MHERPQQSPFAIHFQITRRPNGRRAYVAGENGIVVSELTDLVSNKLWMTACALVSFGRQFVQSFPRFAVMFAAFFQMFVVVVLLQFWQKRLECNFGVADQSMVD